MLIVDANEDLAYNALVDGRDCLQSAYATRAAEVGGPVPETSGLCMLGLPEWLRGGVAVVFATLTAIPLSEARASEPGYVNTEEAHRQAVAQLEIYGRWAASHPQITLVTHRHHLDEVLQSWAETHAGSADRRQVGLVLLIENERSHRRWREE